MYFTPIQPVVFYTSLFSKPEMTKIALKICSWKKVMIWTSLCIDHYLKFSFCFVLLTFFLQFVFIKVSTRKSGGDLLFWFYFLGMALIFCILPVARVIALVSEVILIFVKTYKIVIWMPRFLILIKDLCAKILRK